MFEFDAHFYDTRIFIGGKKEYKLGEILKKYLSKNIKGIDDIHHKCKRYLGQLHYPESQEEANSCDELFQVAMIFYTRLDEIISSFPPYNSMNLKTNRLYDLLNEYTWMFDNEPDLKEWDSYERRNPKYNDHFYTNIPLDKVNDPDTMDEILKFNAELKAFALEYVTFVEDLIKVKNVYEPFLELIWVKHLFKKISLCLIITLSTKHCQLVSGKFEQSTRKRFFDAVICQSCRLKNGKVLLEEQYFWTVMLQPCLNMKIRNFIND